MTTLVKAETRSTASDSRPAPGLQFKPKYRYSHPENYLFLLPKNILIRSKYILKKKHLFCKNLHWPAHSAFMACSSSYEAPIFATRDNLQCCRFCKKGRLTSVCQEPHPAPYAYASDEKFILLAEKKYNLFNTDRDCALSTMEAEYESASLRGRAVMWLRKLWPPVHLFSKSN